MAEQRYSGKTPVAITDSFSNPYDGIVGNLPTQYRRVFNELLPPGACGIYIGGSGNYKLFVEPEGVDEGNYIVVPYLQIAGSIIHPMSVQRIMQDDRYTTDAPNIIVLY